MPPIPSYPGVYVQEVPSGARPIAGAPTSVAAFLGTALQGPIDKAVRISRFSDYEHVFGGLSGDSELGYAVRQFFLNGGADAWVLRTEDAAPTAQRKGLRALGEADFNLLCLPAVAHGGVLAEAASCCEERRAFLIADAPGAATDPASMAQAAAGAALPGSDHAAVYYPWVHVSDPLKNGAPRPAPPCGTIAGLYARTDGARGVWAAPSGTEARLAGVVSLAASLTDNEIGSLSPLGVNCLRTLPGHGPVCWGARTLQGASEYKYVPVRRLALFLEQSLRGGTQWAAFEPNDEPLWAQIRLNAGAFMHALFRQGAFQGGTPRDAYFVKCDGETTTQNDVDQGMLNIVAGFAPLKPAEFVVIRIAQPAGRMQA